jgi:hypothetical protein
MTIRNLLAAPFWLAAQVIGFASISLAGVAIIVGAAARLVDGDDLRA